MEPSTLKFLAESCEGVLSGDVAERRFCGVSTDTRHLGAGQAFFALSGPRFDGHDFLTEAAARGAVVVVVERGRMLPDLGCPVLTVGSPRRALGCWAGIWRGQWPIPVVAVAGSNGKTTTKDLLASVLGRQYRTLSSRASYNNDVGVPLTLLELARHHEAAVLEVGTNHPGELAPLVKMIQPTVGVMTSLGREHLEHFGTLEAVAEEEGYLGELLGQEGRFFVNGDSPLVDRVTARSRAPVVRVGLQTGNDWRATLEAVDADGVTFVVSGCESRWDGEYRLPLLGRHQVTNALLAIAVGAHLGLERDAILLGLAQCPQPRGRMESRRVNGLWVLDDAYNANPDSVMAALETLRALPCSGRRIAVLGDMAEVGARAEELHAEVGERAAGLGLDGLWVVGPLAARVGWAAREAGMEAVEMFADVDGATHALVGAVSEGDVVLVKASRSARLERISDALCNQATVP